MANHLRRQIRDAAIAVLTGLTSTGANVFPSRVYELQDAELPALRIDTNDEEVEIAAFGGSSRAVARTLQLLVQACVKQNTGYNDTIDQIIKEVEIAVAANQGMGGAKYVQLKTIAIEMSGDAEKPIAVATLTFICPYYHALGTPDVAL